MRILTGTLAKLKLVKTVPRGETSVTRALISISPRRLLILTNLPVADAPVLGVVRMDLERLLIEQVVDAAGAAGLGAGVVGLQPAAGGEPDRELVVDDLGRIAVADDLEERRARS